MGTGKGGEIDLCWFILSQAQSCIYEKGVMDKLNRSLLVSVCDLTTARRAYAERLEFASVATQSKLASYVVKYYEMALASAKKLHGDMQLPPSILTWLELVS